MHFIELYVSVYLQLVLKLINRLFLPELNFFKFLILVLMIFFLVVSLHLVAPKVTKYNY